MRVETGFILCVIAAALVPLLPMAANQESRAPRGDATWPARFEGRPLVQLPLSSVEQRFAARFPGRIARFSDGSRNIIMRVVDQPTRLLHPAEDCFRGIGYRVEPSQVRRDEEGIDWSCFKAERDGRRRSVCERIYDEQGGAWTDVSSWYWTAALGKSRGPWWAVTVAGAP
jgi:hypothetical protein